ncbi:hypothetical protein F7725_018447 [Dissostichus mawsoni]|uniref:Ephrin-A1 n=1 Tax=Dissostichus mawsoni TaxID=36200 RepID=A0A7J5XRL5_DISMA|nr:hypothetical protein F7725_018447 [Dissostichus mawsoni]
MELVYLMCLALSIGAWFACAERHSVYWNGSNPNFLWDEYTVEVHINDYLDIICPHYAHGEVSSHAAERYVLYMVEKEDYEVCKPHSFDQLPKPMHHHGQDCLRLKVDVAGNSGSAKTNVEKPKAENTGKSSDGGKEKSPSGGVHNPSNRLPADDPAAMEPKVQRSVGSSQAKLVSFSLVFTLLPALLALMLHQD